MRYRGAVSYDDTYVEKISEYTGKTYGGLERKTRIFISNFNSKFKNLIPNKKFNPKFKIPSFKFDVPNYKLNSKFLIPHIVFQIPNSEIQVPNFKFQIQNFKIYVCSLYF